LAHHDIDVPVIISDYLDITHAFYEGSESKLVNGVLDQISKAVRDSVA
jgi:N utilization substance protein B